MPRPRRCTASSSTVDDIGVKVDMDDKLPRTRGVGETTIQLCSHILHRANTGHTRRTRRRSGLQHSGHKGKPAQSNLHLIQNAPNTRHQALQLLNLSCRADCTTTSYEVAEPTVADTTNAQDPRRSPLEGSTVLSNPHTKPELDDAQCRSRTWGAQQGMPAS